MIGNKYKKLIEEQEKLAEEVVLRDSFDKVDTIAAYDEVYSEDKIIAAVIVMKGDKVIEKKFSMLDLAFPYIPGLLSYRVAPAIVDAFNKLENKPTVLLLNFHGILHVRRFGAACHIGLLLDQPTIGVGSALLIGREEENKVYVDKELRGIKLLTKEHAKPIYVSPGHKISLGTAVNIIKTTLKGHKLPEPLHQAHKYANFLKKQYFKKEESKEEDN